MPRRYIRVHWIHDSPDDPVELYSELGEGSWELRKVEVFPDGHMRFADSESEVGETRLSIEPIPPLAEIAADSQFIPEEIQEAEFETIWDVARQVGSPK